MLLVDDCGTEAREAFDIFTARRESSAAFASAGRRAPLAAFISAESDFIWSDGIRTSV